MTVCKFWEQGHCRFGERCRFEHPSNTSQDPRVVSFNGNSRFTQAPNNSRNDNFRNDNARNDYYRNDNSRNDYHRNNYRNDNSRNDNSRNSTSRSSSAHNRGPANASLPFNLEKQSIINDLTTETPQWILSCYGPGAPKTVPEQLFGGPIREQSFEEMRLLHYIAAAAGNPQQAVQEANKLFADSQQQMQTTVSNIDAAIEYIVSAESKHPNRLDILQMSAGRQGGFDPNTPYEGAAVSAFGGATSTSTFGQLGQPSTGVFGQSSPAFTQGTLHGPVSAFGQSSQHGTSSFGQTGQHVTSAFGQPSVGQPLASAFGQPGTLGQATTSIGTASFGTPAQLGSTGAFGQPAGIGQRPSPWGAPSMPVSNIETGLSAFSNNAGAPSQASAFGRPSQQGVFGQAQSANPFGQPQQPLVPPANAPTSNPFGQPMPNAAPSGFADPQPSTFAKSFASFGAPAPSNALGANAVQHEASAMPFPALSQSPAQPTVASPFGQPSLKSEASNTSGQSQIMSNGSKQSSLNRFPTPQPITQYATFSSHGLLLSFKGLQVQYKDDIPWTVRGNNLVERIWCPKGTPHINNATEAAPQMYTPEIEAAYLHLRQTGEFRDSVMPLIPPKREWSSYEF